jgi:hypothetical protein
MDTTRELIAGEATQAWRATEEGYGPAQERALSRAAGALAMLAAMAEERDLAPAEERDLAELATAVRANLAGEPLSRAEWRDLRAKPDPCPTTPELGGLRARLREVLLLPEDADDAAIVENAEHAVDGMRGANEGLAQARAMLEAWRTEAWRAVCWAEGRPAAPDLRPEDAAVQDRLQRIATDQQAYADALEGFRAGLRGVLVAEGDESLWDDARLLRTVREVVAAARAVGQEHTAGEDGVSPEALDVLGEALGVRA